MQTFDAFDGDANEARQHDEPVVDDRFYCYSYLQPESLKVWVNLDEIPASLAGIMGIPVTLQHKNVQNVKMCVDEKHFKRLGTLIAVLAVQSTENGFAPRHMDPAIILKSQERKVVANPGNLLVVSNATGVINSAYMCDSFLHYLLKQVQKLPGEAVIIMDSASAHLSEEVLAAFRAAGLRFAIIPGGLTCFIHAYPIAVGSGAGSCRGQHP